MKKIVSVLLTGAMLLGATASIPLSASAATTSIVASDATYTKNIKAIAEKIADNPKIKIIVYCWNCICNLSSVFRMKHKNSFLNSSKFSCMKVYYIRTYNFTEIMKYTGTTDKVKNFFSSVENLILGRYSKSTNKNFRLLVNNLICNSRRKS